MARIIILGGGITGLATAFFLDKKGYSSYKIFEKEPTIGGLCSSVKKDGFTFDFTGHVIHSNNPIFTEFIQETIGFDALKSIQKNTWIYSHETYTRYPFQRNLYGLPSAVIADCIEGFVRRPRKKKIATFHDWVLHHFGAGFGQHFFFPFQQKNFSYDLKKITAEWTSRFVPDTSLAAIIEGALRDNTMQGSSYNAQFYYPAQGGMASFMDAIEQKLSVPAFTSMCVSKIDLDTKCVIFQNGHHEYYDFLITTIPLNGLLSMISGNDYLNKAASKLLCNSVININVGIDRPWLSDKHWVYFPEKKYPFYRLGFPYAISSSLVPTNMSSVSAEVAYLHKKPGEIDELINQTKNHIVALFGLDPAQITTEAVVSLKHGYVMYDQWRAHNLDSLLNSLASYNIYSIGRYGSWKYASMQESVIDAKNCIDAILPTPSASFKQPQLRTHNYAIKKIL